MDDFYLTRKKMLEGMTEIANDAGLEVITKEIPFKNKDVPEFLKKLDAFEENSRKTILRVKCDYNEMCQGISSRYW